MDKQTQEVLHMMAQLLTPQDQRYYGGPGIACTSNAQECKALHPQAAAWSVVGAGIACAITFRVSILKVLDAVTHVFNTENYDAHWKGLLKCPRWTQDEMIAMLQKAELLGIPLLTETLGENT